MLDPNYYFLISVEENKKTEVFRPEQSSCCWEWGSWMANNVEFDVINVACFDGVEEVGFGQILIKEQLHWKQWTKRQKDASKHHILIIYKDTVIFHFCRGFLLKWQDV